MTLKCPICKKNVHADNPAKPFCSERCRITDLGAWSSEKYVISTPVQPQQDDGEE